MAGLLLARGTAVTVLREARRFPAGFLQEHGPSRRRWRCWTARPSAPKLHELPQSRLTRLLLPGTDSQRVPVDIFAALPAPYNYVAMVPQSVDLLNLLRGRPGGSRRSGCACAPRRPAWSPPTAG